MPTCIIFNPTARGAKAERFRHYLEHTGTEAALKPTTAAGSATQLARQAITEGFDTIVAAGGDGTINEVINGLAAGDGCHQARLGVLPLGTANVFARQLKLPLDIPSAWRIIQQGGEKQIDLPTVNFQTNDSPQQRAFIQLAGAGLDSMAIAKVDWAAKKQFGFASYIWAGLQAMAQPRQPITVTSAQHQARGELVLIGNGNFYGGQFNFFPRAHLDDGLLDVLVFSKVRWLTLLEFGWGWMTDQLHTIGDAISWQTDRLSLHGDPGVPFELDGDNVGTLPATFALHHKRLRVIC